MSTGSDRPVERIHALQADTDQEHREVIEAGGLHIFGTERHEARRIDNQLRGGGRRAILVRRASIVARDDLMRIFAKEWVRTAATPRMEEGVPLNRG